jgi:hypothetical protein
LSLSARDFLLPAPELLREQGDSRLVLALGASHLALTPQRQER